MTIRLSRWGNSTGLRLPAAIMEAAGLKVGDYVFLRLLDSGDIRVRPTKVRQVVVAAPAQEAALAKPPELDRW